MRVLAEGRSIVIQKADKEHVLLIRENYYVSEGHKKLRNANV